MNLHRNVDLSSSCGGQVAPGRDLFGTDYWCVYCGRKWSDMDMEAIDTADAARDKAIDWQSWASEQNLSMGEFVEWASYFEDLADRFGLEDEYRENGII